MRKECTTSTSMVLFKKKEREIEKEITKKESPSTKNTPISHRSIISWEHITDWRAFPWSLLLLLGRCFQMEILRFMESDAAPATQSQ